jgi:hypothetical protein
MTLKSLLLQLGLYRPFVNYKYLPDENHIEVLNFYPTDIKKLWHYQFITHHFNGLLTRDNSLLISSVFGPKKAVALSKSHTKLFYTGENVMRFPEYKDQCRSISDIVIGFDYLDDERYQRFPIWLEYFFYPTADRELIRRFVSQFVNREICHHSTRKFASLVASHDKGNIRTILFNSLSQIGRVDSGGRHLNNTNELKKAFNDDKATFIGHYKFNICPENSNREGYVTEKLFEAIRSNTIPVYWGSNNNPEPEVLNKSAILFYEGPGSLPCLNRQIEELHNNPRLYREFLEQPRFQPQAAEYIIHLFDSLYTKLHQVLKRKQGNMLRDIAPL